MPENIRKLDNAEIYKEISPKVRISLSYNIFTYPKIIKRSLVSYTRDLFINHNIILFYLPL